MSFHENLRYYRKKAGYSTQKMANLLGITANTYAGYEKNVNPNIKPYV